MPSEPVLRGVSEQPLTESDEALLPVTGIVQLLCGSGELLHLVGSLLSTSSPPAHQDDQEDESASEGHGQNLPPLESVGVALCGCRGVGSGDGGQRWDTRRSRGLHVSNDGEIVCPTCFLEQIDPHPHRPRVKTKPESLTFITGRVGYYNSIDPPETAIHYSQRALKDLYLLPLPVFAKDALPHLQTVRENMSGLLSMKLTTSQYRRVTGLLSRLNDHQRIADIGGYSEHSLGLSALLEMFERDNKATVLARGIRNPVKSNEHGRSYTLGKRKELARRLSWSSSRPLPSIPRLRLLPLISGLDPTFVAPDKIAIPATTTEILVNSMLQRPYDCSRG